MAADTPDGTIDYQGHRIDYYIIGKEMFFDDNHFEAFMADVPGYVRPAHWSLKPEARGAVSLARANGKEDFADYVYRKYGEFL